MARNPVVIQPRMPVGPQGPKGDPAPEAKIQYSTDNSTWHDTFQAGDKYMRISTDGGSTWTQGYKFIGDDGQDAPNVLIQFSPDNSNWHTDYQQGDAYVRFSNDNGVTWTNGVPVAVNADTLDGYHASDFLAMIDQKVDEFIVPTNGDTVVWHKVGELTTDIGAAENNLTLLVSGVSDFGSNKPGVDVVQISTRGGVSVDVYSLTTPGIRSQTYGYVNNTSTGKTEIWVKRDTYTYDTRFAVLNVYDEYGATYGNLASSSTEPSGIVYVDIKTLGVNASGAAPTYACRAWVNFDGTTTPPTIRASGNVSSVTKNATGDYTVNFATPMPDNNYSVVITSGSGTANPGDARISCITSISSASCRYITFPDASNNKYDSLYSCVSIFR